MTNDIEQLEQRIKTEQALLRKKKREQRAKLSKQLGTEVLKATKVENLDDFRNNFVVVRKDQSQTSENEQALTELKAIANDMTYNNNYWTIQNLPKVAGWLAGFRDEH